MMRLGHIENLSCTTMDLYSERKAGCKAALSSRGNGGVGDALEPTVSGLLAPPSQPSY